MEFEEKNKIKHKIEHEIKSLNNKIDLLVEQCRPIEPENSIGRVSRMDAINNKSVVESSLRLSKQRLSKLVIVKNKINDNDFGVCFNCKQKIPIERLLLLPESSKCVKCAN